MLLAGRFVRPVSVRRPVRESLWDAACFFVMETTKKICVGIMVAALGSSVLACRTGRDDSPAGGAGGGGGGGEMGGSGGSASGGGGAGPGIATAELKDPTGRA